jgi:hypothetical protein
MIRRVDPERTPSDRRRGYSVAMGLPHSRRVMYLGFSRSRVVVWEWDGMKSYCLQQNRGLHGGRSGSIDIGSPHRECVLPHLSSVLEKVSRLATRELRSEGPDSSLLKSRKSRHTWRAPCQVPDVLSCTLCSRRSHDARST